MLAVPPNQDRIRLLSELEESLLGQKSKVTQNLDEVLAAWYASPFVKRVCLSQPDWLEKIFSNGALQKNFDQECYQQELDAVFSQAHSVEEVQKLLRQARTAAFARITWRDLHDYATVDQSLNELSLFAEICLQKTLHWCFCWQQSRPGSGKFEKDLENKIVIFALGKLGGGELNFSSDVDLVMSYSDEVSYSQVELGKLTAFYLKVVQLFIKVLSEQTQDGFVFRVDTRLRPFGESGPLLTSFSAIDQYFQVHGRDWERYAWMKARVVAGDIEDGQAFLKSITPFIYRRYFDYGAMQSLREMKSLIDNKAQLNIGKEDLKIGIGGIREIEFIAQMFQLIYGGKNKALRVSSTRQALAILESQEILSTENASCLTVAYNFLRKAENVLQMREDQQTHVLPTDSGQQTHYAYAVGEKDWESFHSNYKQQTNTVSKIFNSLLNESDESSLDNGDSTYKHVWQQIEEQEFCRTILKQQFNDDAEHIYQKLVAFHQSDLVKKLVPLSRERLDAFIPIFLCELKNYNEAPVIINRFFSILGNIAQRSTYISLLIENKHKISILFKLIRESQWIAQYLATHPVLLDDVLSLSDDYEPPDFVRMQNQLLTQVDDSNDLEVFMERLREFKHSQVIQIAAADIVENFPIMKVSDHLSWLAEICLTQAMRFAKKDLEKKYGSPQCIKEGLRFEPELLVVEYGKLGGFELGYGSDLDVVFLHNSEGEQCETCGSKEGKKIHNDIFFARLTQRTIHILTTVTSNGKVFDIDLRLRPHGASGPATTSLSAYERYLLKEAWLWELQALVRARAVTNSSKLADGFVAVRKKVLTLAREKQEVNASILEMRNKMISNDNNQYDSEFNIKKSKGGVIDIEFMVQFLVLSHSNSYPELAEHTDNIRILDVCSAVGILDAEVAQDLQSIYLKYREHLHRLSLKLLPGTVNQDAFADEMRKVQKYWVSLLHSDAT